MPRALIPARHAPRGAVWPREGEGSIIASDARYKGSREVARVTSLVEYVVRTTLVLLIVGGLGAGLIWIARRGNRGRPSSLDLIARLPLEGRRAVYLVRIGSKVLVLGGSEAGLTRLGTVDPDSIAELVEPAARPEGSSLENPVNEASPSSATRAGKAASLLVRALRSPRPSRPSTESR